MNELLKTTSSRSDNAGSYTANSNLEKVVQLLGAGQVCELELENTLRFVGQVPYFEVPEFIAVADVAV